MGRYWSLTWSWRGYNVSHVAAGRVNEGNNVPKRPNNV